ncbi:maleylpyruvate isomerase N-terminal domain-containing protein [Solwaraspora sp. WMMD406]|uniref:maleylpyruvate isomerase N-terminal domain-containing protein n=1 Tax=Solwaraspora sp. WMMD406 TaxID=3016095 RepID=UPI0024168C3F|nr:maleylpyruvate isomerase N-terminal domain-containing protein [Solwaraspora sp. WMMD406]MDG4766526.1 maleylpyruvate isomerase N-terminal domain-containing protein [Solwaraspora sp. WMMD406]
MTYTVPAHRWTLTRTALRAAGDRFRTLLTDGTDPTAMATREWTVADSAAHVLSIAVLYVALVEDSDVAVRIPDIETILPATNVDTVADVNDHVLRHFTERDPDRLADQLGEAIDAILVATTRTPPETTLPWLGDARVPVCGVLAHLVNELLVHGWDMARAVRRPWPIPDDHAALYWDQFFLGMLHHDYGVLLDTSLPMPKRPIAVRFRSAYTPTATIVLGDRRIRLAPPDHPVDVQVRFRPARFNLMLFGRTSTAVAALRRDVVISGPRPWRLPAFLRVVHMPNARLAPNTATAGRCFGC